MKNKMLALVALCGATSSTMPLWAAEWADPVSEFAAPDLKTDGTGGGVYYVYHVATQKFMCNGNYKDNCQSICLIYILVLIQIFIFILIYRISFYR